eukprot:TRINITY_DN46866_c0_g1_i1.p1 TRINITY_DN46866_c0_g1~~TRINITY_DN46866_c0_g1_i1.p1  ORF type:complete len:443 (-),score=86.63 TRINITY_DN46866_c0_g1_i1:179-1507(-)
MAKRSRLAATVCLCVLLKWSPCLYSFVHGPPKNLAAQPSAQQDLREDAKHRRCVRVRVAPDGTTVQERPAVSAPSSGDAFFTRLDSVLTPEEVAKTLKLAKEAYYSKDATVGATEQTSSAVKQRTLHAFGQWDADAGEFRQVLDRPMKELQRRVLELNYAEGKDVEIWRMFLCRYTRDDGLRGLDAHWDVNSMISASCSLSEPLPESGFYVVGGDDVNDKAFVNLPAGDFAVHGWDVRHGVSTHEDEDRFSLVVWWRPKDSFTSETFFCGPTADSNSPNPYAVFSRGELAIAAKEFNIAEKWFRCGTEHGQSLCELGLAAIATIRGDMQQAKDIMSQNDFDFQYVGRLAKRLTDLDYTEGAKVLLRGSETPAAFNQLALVAVKAGNVEEARALLLKAAEGGELSAMNNLAMFLYKGIGGPVDQDGAVEWSRRAVAAAESSAS